MGAHDCMDRYGRGTQKAVTVSKDKDIQPLMGTLRTTYYGDILMDMWMKIGSAMLLGMMLLMIWPRAKTMLKESPKGSSQEWKSALIPLLLVAGFIILLILAV